MTDLLLVTLGSSPLFSPLAFILRAIITYWILLMVTRLMSQRVIADMQTFDFVVVITIGSIAATALTDPRITMWTPLLAALVFVANHVVNAEIALRSKWFSRKTGGEPVVLVKDGQIQEENMAKSRLVIDDLMEQMRLRNVFNLSDVELAIMEANGSITVMKKRSAQPITLKDLGQKRGPQRFPAFLIVDGRVLHDNLEAAGLGRAWLNQKLAERGIHDPAQVFVAQLSSGGTLFLDTYDDREPADLDVSKDLILTRLHKLEADFTNFAMETNDQEAKVLYSQLSEESREVAASLASIWPNLQLDRLQEARTGARWPNGAPTPDDPAKTSSKL